MSAVARSILAFCLTLALTVSGVPFAHAMPVQAAVHDAQARGHETGHAMHHQMQREASADHRNDVSPDAPVTRDDLCKDQKCCSMCATAYVAPVLRNLHVERLTFAVRYRALHAFRREAMTFIDPGIPIA